MRCFQRVLYGNGTRALKQLASAPLLVHYSSSLPLRLACNASAYGVGAVISHFAPDGSGKPIAYSSSTLSKTERNYSQIEKEALRIVFGVKSFTNISMVDFSRW